MAPLGSVEDDKVKFCFLVEQIVSVFLCILAANHLFIKMKDSADFYHHIQITFFNCVT